MNSELNLQTGLSSELRLDGVNSFSGLAQAINDRVNDALNPSLKWKLIKDSYEPAINARDIALRKTS